MEQERSDDMKVYELIERVKKGGSAENIEGERLLDAVRRIERRIEERASLIGDRSISVTPADYRNVPVPEGESFKEKVLYACGGGVSAGYEDMYEAYLNREACAIREDWECFNVYDAIFTARFKDLCKEIIRNRTPKRFSFR